MSDLTNILQSALNMHQQGRLSEAVSLYKRILAEQPSNFNALFLLATANAQQHKFEDALVLFEKAHELNPLHPETLNNRGNVLKELKHYEEALESYDLSLAVRPGDAETYTNRGVVLQELKRYEEALLNFEKAVSLNPLNPLTYNNQGVVLLHLERYEEAISCYDRAIELKSDYAEAYNNRGNGLRELEHYDEALESYRKAIAYVPDYSEAFNNQGNTYLKLKRYEEAAESYKKAIILKPRYASAYNNLGKVFLERKYYQEAYACFEKSIKIMPDSKEVYQNIGYVCKEMKQYEKALLYYDIIISMDAENADAYRWRASVLSELRRYSDAIESYEKALEIKPDADYVIGEWISAKMRICDWNDISSHIRSINEKINENKKVCNPFAYFALTDSPDLHKKASAVFAESHYPSNNKLPHIGKREIQKKIHIGYFSSDLRNHACSYLLAGMFEMHDREKFETTAFSFGPDRNDEMRKRLVPAFDRFIDVLNMTDIDVAELSRELEIDIAVDIGGYTTYCRTGILALRAAPLQVNYLGFPGTMSAEYIDYIIADATLIPEENRECYTEKIIYLPDTYQPNDSTRLISARVFTRQELDLPETGFVFCCFNNNYKIAPEVFNSWMKILRNVDGSVLWLIEDTAAAGNLRREAQAREVNPDRLIFARRISSNSEHLARQRCADLFLDTIPYNAHTTASDALWAGLPVLTLIGNSFPARVAASLLNAIHLPELITNTREEYEILAVELATDPEKLKVIRQKLNRNRLTAPLFDTRRYTKHIEKAYEQIFERYYAGLFPDHISVKPEIL